MENCVIVNQVFNNMPQVISSETFLEDLLELKYIWFDLILGIDLLSKYEVVMDCNRR